MTKQVSDPKFHLLLKQNERLLFHEVKFKLSLRRYNILIDVPILFFLSMGLTFPYSLLIGVYLLLVRVKYARNLILLTNERIAFYSKMYLPTHYLKRKYIIEYDSHWSTDEEYWFKNIENTWLGKERKTEQQIWFAPALKSNFSIYIPKENTVLVFNEVVQEWKTASVFKQLDASLEKFAKQYALSITPFDPIKRERVFALSGEIRNLPLEIKINGTSKIKGLEIRIQLPPQGFSMLLTPHGKSDNFAMKFGLQDLIIGDKDFDKFFLIQSNDEERLKNLLTANNRKLIQEVQRFVHSYQVQPYEKQEIKELSKIKDDHRVLDLHVLKENRKSSLTRVVPESSELVFTAIFEQKLAVSELNKILYPAFASTLNLGRAIAESS